MASVKSIVKNGEAAERFRVLKHSGYLLLARLFARLASFPFMLYTAVRLGPSLFGAFAFTLASVEMLSALGDLGLSRYGARELIRQDSRRASLAGIILTLQLLVSVVLTVAAVVILLLLSPGPAKRDVLLLGLAAAFVSSFIFTTDTVFTAYRRFGASAVFAVVGRAVYLAAGFAALRLGYSVVAVTAAFLLGYLVESALRMAYTGWRVTPFSFGFHRGELSAVIAGSVPFALSAVATLVYFRADTLIMEVLRGDTDVGIYNAAYSFFAFFVWAPIILARTLLPGLTERFRTDPEGAERANWFWLRAVGAASVPVAFVMTMIAGPLIRSLMPPDFNGSIIALQVLMWSIPPLMMVTVGFNALVVTNRERQAAGTTVATALIIVVLDLVLIHYYGVTGAAAAMVAATTLWLAQVHWLLRREVMAPGHGLAGAYGLPLVGGALMAGAALAASPLGLWAALAAGIAAYGAACGAWAAAARR